MTIFYSHSKQNPDGTTYGSKHLVDHTMAVTDKALRSFHTHVTMQTNLPLTDVLRLVGLYHDLGKYTTHFQNYLLKSGEFNQELKQHAKFGGFALYQKYHSLGLDNVALWAAYLIIHHHKSLTDINDLKGYAVEDSTEEYIFNQQAKTIQSALEQIAVELNEPALESYLKYPDKKLIKTVRDLERKPNIQNYFLISYLFSLLIESDKLDASDTTIYTRKPLSSTLVDLRLQPVLFQPYTPEELTTLGQNELRSYVRGAVMQHLEKSDILEKRLFTLTAPTGIGKTLTALDFALRLKAKIRTQEQYEAQIIYALPFINIIEQAIIEYKRVIGDHGQVLAHYQFADALEQLSSKKDDEENQSWNQKTMLLDTWQSDVVITTFVQFLQTLIGNRNKLLKKFHHYAGAIVILDEVQTIRLEQLPLIGAALFYAAKFLNTRIILMTATKPKTFELANREIIAKEGDVLSVTELLTEHEAVFAAFKRTKIIPLINQPIVDETEFVESYFTPNWSVNRSCLIVCNLVKRSVDLFTAIREYLGDKGYQNKVYYLSTNIIPAHRLRVIDQVKLDLKTGFKPILIATQCVEAGVDLDFDMGFRDVGPIDSIVQVAGRINRENSEDRQHSPLYVIDFDDCEKIYDRTTATQSRQALTKGADENNDQIPEEKYLTLIGEYYDNLSADGIKSFKTAREIFGSMKRLNYDNEDKKTYPVSSFQVIDQKGFAVSVFIEIDDEASTAKDAFLDLIYKKMSKETFDTNYKLAFNQRIITIPKYLSKVKELQMDNNRNQLVEGLFIVNRDEVQNYYDEITGFDRRKESASTSETCFF
ncbi:CRISPR-associated helicase Cas3' [Larkinella punicea]|uniref:CRISPR-associated helicase Cas3 n=1 Tax=Larkinella punicea TaxID=2315727 RepID=A0A368JT82_9BACT|nr:CRISPR-associated helicase Cas3' [Larkinella punicea]RCR70545.1 CRISPR-associated helicase Cas3' [Larkinella punicea]